MLIMIENIEEITKKEIESFYNKYKYNSDLIVKLERRLLTESFSYEKWQNLLIMNSELTRTLFIENEQLLETYIKPILIHADLLSNENINCFLLYISFFLYENRIDSLVTVDLLNSFQKISSMLSANIMYNTCFFTGLSNTLLNHDITKNNYEMYQKTCSYYMQLSDNTNIYSQTQFIFCKLVQLLDLAIQQKVDITLLIDNIYNACTVVQNLRDEQLLSHMWGDCNDYNFHIKLLQRYLKIYGIFALGYNDIRPENNDNIDIIIKWLNEEYQQELEDTNINPMIFAIYYKYQYYLGCISQNEYRSILQNKYDQFIDNKITDYQYPNNIFLSDDEPICKHFTDVLNTVKIFCDSFSFVFIFLPDVLKITQDSNIINKIITNTKSYYEQMPYNEKGLLIDKFIINNIQTIMPYLSSIENIQMYLQTIFVHRQISTAIHFSMVSKLSSLCLKYFIQSKPELFVGFNNSVTGSDVIKQQKDLSEFIQNASLLHDIGKIYCSDIINLHFRKITESEFDLIKEHPKKGSLIIQSNPIIKEYSDVILGHHKSYDGKSGYPLEFDNTKSKYRSIIDLITICDCIDAATDVVGRNYAKGKTFDIILQELKKDAGTRYNPAMVELILSNKKLIHDITYLTGEGRKEAYYQTYTQYVKPHTYFTEKQEKKVIQYTEKHYDQLLQFYQNAWNNQNINQTIDFLQNLISPKNFSGYLLIDEQNVVYGICLGRIFNAYQNTLFNTKTFMCDDFRILPEYRRKGLGLILLSEVENQLQKIGCKEIHISVCQDQKTESFFWINGFEDDQFKLMKKII